MPPRTKPYVNEAVLSADDVDAEYSKYVQSYLDRFNVSTEEAVHSLDYYVRLRLTFLSTASHDDRMHAQPPHASSPYSMTLPV